jgi:hypothetical protein
MTRPRLLPLFGIAVALLLTLTSAVRAQRDFSSANRQRGRAAVEFSDKDIHIAAAYYYSQRNHDSRWIMIDAALSTTKRTTFRRDAIALQTPAGREVALATQTRVGEDTTNVERLLRHARVEGHDVLSYFPQREYTYPMRLFTFPFNGVVMSEFVVDRNEVASGPLFFESPTGAWEDGTYALIVRHQNGAAELPIRLE